jgi:hypothetical protein
LVNGEADVIEDGGLKFAHFVDFRDVLQLDDGFVHIVTHLFLVNCE